MKKLIHSQRNIEATGEFTCSVATRALTQQMNMSSASVSAEVDEFLLAGPSANASELMDRLAAMTPEVYGSKAQLRTLQRRVGEWRSERAKDMVLGSLRKADAKAVEHQ